MTETVIQVANAPCSWGVLELQEVAAAAVGWRTVLAEMRASGYHGTELGDWGFLPSEPDALREALEEHGLSLVGAFVPVALADADAHQAGERLALRTARLTAQVAPGAWLVLSDDNGRDATRTHLAGRIGEEHGLSSDAWRIFASGAERIARAVLDDTGLRTVFHHHCGGFVETPQEVQRLMELTSPELIGLCLDTGHFTYGGGDACEALERYGERVRHVHFKDCSAAMARRAREEGLDYCQGVGGGIFCELGRGAVDFASVLADLRARDYDGWIVVEQDVLPDMGAPVDSARRNRAFLAELDL